MGFNMINLVQTTYTLWSSLFQRKSQTKIKLPLVGSFIFSFIEKIIIMSPLLLLFYCEKPETGLPANVQTSWIKYSTCKYIVQGNVGINSFL